MKYGKEQVFYENPFLEIHQTSDGANPGVCAFPFTKALILAGPQVVVAPPVVGLLVYQPVAVQDVAGVEVGEVKATHEVWAVIC